MSQLSHEERLNIISEFIQASEEGRNDEALKIGQQLPLAPHIAKAAKDVWGAEYLKNSGFDLSEAEAAYGKNWLDQ